MVLYRASWYVRGGLQVFLLFFLLGDFHVTHVLGSGGLFVASTAVFVWSCGQCCSFQFRVMLCWEWLVNVRSVLKPCPDLSGEECRRSSYFWTP